MRKIYNNLCWLAMLTILLASCKKEGDQYFIKQGSFTTNGLTASSTNLILTSAADNDTAVKFKWFSADFGQKAAVTYTLQIDLPSDTSGTNAWANAKSITAGNNVLTFGFITKDLNNLLVGMALPGGTSSALVLRIKSDVQQYNGSASSVPSIYSSTLIIHVTPYILSMYIPGDYQGWDPSKAPMLNPVAGKAGLYEAYEYMPGNGMLYFKYTNAPDWNHTNYGDGGNGTFSIDGNAGGLHVPIGGYYELTANLNNNTWTATKTTWGILGDATPGGWATDTQLIYDDVNQVWKVTVAIKANGSFKFRANNDWSIDFGIDSKGNLTYADNSFFGYNSSVNNLSVPTDGIYTITLDLHTSGKYLYSLVKN